MITLFIFNGELIAGLVIVVLVALYGWSKYSLAKQIELDNKIRQMSDSQLVDRFQSFMTGMKQKSRHCKSRELFALFKAHEERGLLKNVPDAELIDKFSRLKADYELKQTFWKWKEFTYFQKEMEKRSLVNAC